MEILKENTNRGGRAGNYHNSPKPHSNILDGSEGATFAPYLARQ